MNLMLLNYFQLDKDGLAVDQLFKHFLINLGETGF